MNDDQARNRDAWDQIYRNEDYFPEGYAPAQGYDPVEARNGYSDNQGSTTKPYHQTQGVDEYSDSETSATSSYGSQQNASTADDNGIPEEEIREFVSSRRQKHEVKSRAKPKEGQPKSARAQRREKVASENNGEVSATDQPKGLVEWHEGVLFWFDPEDKEWVKANYHDQYRDQFIREDRAFEGDYLVTPESGKGANDVTSACSAFNQLEWRIADRESWGNIIDAAGNKVMFSIDRPQNQFYEEPERLWIHDSCVLLDGDNNPVRPWAEIPRCFSSKIEGGRVEALRRILPMTIQDLRARMLRAVPTAAGIGASTKPLSLPSTFGHRSSRFRQQYQCPAWTPRAASAALKKHVTDLLPDAEKATTTEGLQAVSRYEVERRKSSTRGQHLFKANGRAVSEDERKERDRKLDEKLRRQAAREPKSPSRPQSIPVTPLQHTSRNPYLPTPPLSSGNKRLREDDGFGRFGVGQSEPAGKRIRLDASPLVPHLQGRFPAFPSVPKDPFQPALNAYDTPGLVSTNNWNHGQSGSNSIGLGLNFGGLPGPLPQRPEATNTERTVSTNGSPQIDYRFVDPQNPLEKLSIQAAVFYPRAHYYALIGEYPPYFEGTYASQYNQMSALLAQNWMVPGELPTLADIGPWRGSFNMVPTPNLPDELLWIMLHPNPAPLPVPEAPTTDNPSQGSSTNIGVENVQSEPGFDTGLERDMESNDWNDDLFGEYMEDVE